MDMDFAVSCPLVQHQRPISGFCSSTRTFAIRFFQTPLLGGSPCVLTSPSPPSGWAGDLHPQTAEHAQHSTKPPDGGRRCASLRIGRGVAVSSNRLAELSWITRRTLVTHLRKAMLEELQRRNLSIRR